MKILVTGAGGQVARELAQLAAKRPMDEFVFRSSTELNITHADSVWQAIADEEPDYCINAAAYTAVDKAEADPETAFLVNAEGPRLLAAACAAKGARFLHISTDYVFDGNASEPYREDDPVNPLGVYGASKRKGEVQSMEANRETIIVRTAWVYSAFGNNFVKTMLRLMRERPQLSVVNDQHGCPTYAADLAAALLHIIDSGKWTPGIYHYCNEGATTWYHFAEAIRDRAALSTQLLPISTEQYPTPARRPAYSVLDTTKFRSTFGAEIRASNLDRQNQNL
ncbi:MAG: dTDP-4-dehydrorhamnose reductase [Chitinophagaceae bacterium]|nr:MAG: dTDP-4-dehydrorhamnose reductase [Chitinophagaceae bacterium]